MPKFLIERDMPNVGALSRGDLVAASNTSCDVIRALGPDIQWVESYVTGDKITCVYIARDGEIIREHAQRAGFPCNRVTEIVTTIDPTTAEGAVRF